MEMTNCSLNEPDKDILDAIELWYESKRSKRGNVSRNVMAVGIGISELLQNRFPLTNDYVQSDKGSQVRGLSGACIKTVLARHGEMRAFASEGGRTSRGTLPMALELATIINSTLPSDTCEDTRLEAANAIANFFVERIQVDFFNRQRIKVEIDLQKPISVIVDDILAEASLRSDKPTGTVAQHLVGAKLEMLFPTIEIGKDNSNAADQQTDRSGDFQINDAAFHVTVSPMAKLTDRCRDNIRNGIRPIVVVPHDKVSFAYGLFESEGLGNRVQVIALESFIGINIEELSFYKRDLIRLNVARLLAHYNKRIEDIEPDKSLQIEIPQWALDEMDAHGE